MTEPHVCHDAGIISGVEGFRALPQLLRLLSRGEPLELSELTRTAGQAGTDLAEALKHQPGDTLFFTIILGEETAVDSICPGTGVAVHLDLSPESVRTVTPPEAVVSQRHRPDLVGNLRTEVCDHGHFFASARAAADWVTRHPDGQVRRIADAFGECRAACAELGWLSPGAPGQ